MWRIKLWERGVKKGQNKRKKCRRGKIIAWRNVFFFIWRRAHETGTSHRGKFSVRSVKTGKHKPHQTRSQTAMRVCPVQQQNRLCVLKAKPPQAARLPSRRPSGKAAARAGFRLCLRGEAAEKIRKGTQKNAAAMQRTRLRVGFCGIRIRAFLRCICAARCDGCEPVPSCRGRAR